MNAANYLRVGKWTQCCHCKTLNAGSHEDHYCGAPWQTPPLGPFPEGVSEDWVAAVKDHRMIPSAPS